MVYTGMTCDEIREEITLWSTGNSVSWDGGIAASVRRHMGTCSACREKYGAVVPFLMRDAGAGFADSLGSIVSPNFSERMMGRIAGGADGVPARRSGVVLRPRFRALVRSAAAAAAVLVVFFAGFFYRGRLTARDSEIVHVHFTFSDSSARSVKLVGSFPGWTADRGQDMIRDDAGRWMLTVELKKNGIYTYGFLVDDTLWVPDPAAEEVVHDGFGGVNSLIRL